MVGLEGYYCANGVSTICPAGYYCPYEAGATPIICPEGYICRDGFSEPMACSKLSVCKEGATSKTAGAGAIVILVAMIAVTFLAIWLVRILKNKRAKLSRGAAQKHRDLARAFGDVIQSVAGVASASGPMQGFNEKIRYTSPVSIAFNNLGMKLKTNGAVVLEGVTGEFPPGSLVAVMGGSGAGKSTFMNALANRAPYGDVTGEVSLNGVKGETIGKYPRLVGFVPQDDIMHDDLTVYENLVYSARLRLPPSISPEQQRAIVEDVIEILDLNRIRDSIVGSPEKRGISGGQKKRVNIGMELVAYPRVLFLDEPTSGLDSAASLQVARCLQRMRGLGITVVTVIHQPRYSVFRCFSHCLLLAKGGRTAFLGPTGAIHGYFEQCGFELPKGENVADWFIDIVSGQSVRKNPDGSVDRDFLPENDLPRMWWESGQATVADIVASGAMSRQGSGSVTSRVAVETIVGELESILQLPLDAELTVTDISRLCRVKQIETSEEIETSLYKQFADSVSRNEKLTTPTLASIIATNTSATAGLEAAQSNTSGTTERLTNRPGPSFGSQLGALISRNFAKFNTEDLIVKSLVAAAGAIIVGFTFKGALDYSSIPVTGQSGLILFAIISAASYLYVFGDERLVFTRESQTGFSLPAYWISKNLVNLIDVILIAVFFFTFYFIITQPDYYYRQGVTVYILLAWYTSAVSHFFSVTLSQANALLLAVLVPAIEIALLSGTKPLLSEATNFQKVLAYIGVGWYSIEDLTLFEIKALPSYVQNLTPVQEMLSNYSYDIDDLTKNSLIVLLLGFVVRLLTFAALCIKVHGYPLQGWISKLKASRAQKKKEAAAVEMTTPVTTNV
jgi:ABC-type multidrug transport system ATPase subunit